MPDALWRRRTTYSYWEKSRRKELREHEEEEVTTKRSKGRIEEGGSTITIKGGNPSRGEATMGVCRVKVEEKKGDSSWTVTSVEVKLQWLLGNSTW